MHAYIESAQHQILGLGLLLFAPSTEGGSAAVGQRLRILIVEDEYFIALELEQWMQDAGYEVAAIVASADEAVQFACELRPDAVVMDIRLIGARDGVDAAKDIFLLTGARSLFVSAEIDAQMRVRAEPSQPLGWLAKPYTREQFLQALYDALNDGKVPT